MKFSYPEGLSIEGQVALADITTSQQHTTTQHYSYKSTCNTSGSITLNGDTRYTWPVDGAPLYSIIMWTGVSAPTGWEICDGRTVYAYPVSSDPIQITLPNLTDRFIVGTGNNYDVGNVGGAATVNLTSANLPNHSHPITSSATNAGWINHTHNIQMAVDNDLTNGPPEPHSQTDALTIDVQSSGDHTHTVNTLTADGNVGTLGTAHNNLPPYYALYFIMKVQQL